MYAVNLWESSSYQNWLKQCLDHTIHTEKERKKKSVDQESIGTFRNFHKFCMDQRDDAKGWNTSVMWKLWVQHPSSHGPLNTTRSNIQHFPECPKTQGKKVTTKNVLQKNLHFDITNAYKQYI